jgi:hypothetical protein
VYRAAGGANFAGFWLFGSNGADAMSKLWPKRAALEGTLRVSVISLV